MRKFIIAGSLIGALLIPTTADAATKTTVRCHAIVNGKKSWSTKFCPKAPRDGRQGKAGINGINGKDGNQGANGRDGAKGMDGTNGFAGSNGIQGVKGEQGAAGRDGVNGIDGVSGYGYMAPAWPATDERNPGGMYGTGPVAINGTGEVTVICPSGKSLVSGGAYGGGITVTQQRPINITYNGSAFFAGGLKVSASGIGTAQPWAICIKA